VSARNAEYAAKRRLSLENSKALARQLMLERAYSGNSSLSSGIVGQLDRLRAELGRAEYLQRLEQPAALPSTARGGLPGHRLPSPESLPLQPAGPAARCHLHLRAADAPPRLLQRHTRSLLQLWLRQGCLPTLAGDAMVVYRKPERESGEIVLDSNFYLDGRLVVRDPASLFTTASVNLGAKVRLQTRRRELLHPEV